MGGTTPHPCHGADGAFSFPPAGHHTGCGRPGQAPSGRHATPEAEGTIRSCRSPRIMSKEPKEREGRAEVPAPVDYFAISATDRRMWPVSTRMAAHILRELDRWFPPRWIRFVDLSGAAIQVRPREIVDVTQCSADQRALRREFWRAIDREEDAEWK